jgi:hypothetical protein
MEKREREANMKEDRGSTQKERRMKMYGKKEVEGKN